MNDPLNRATSSAPPVLGEGCTQRYDPQALTPESGTEFAGAAELWRQLQQGERLAQIMDCGGQGFPGPCGRGLSTDSRPKSEGGQ